MKIVAVDDEFNSLALFLGEVLGETDVDCVFFACQPERVYDYCKKEDVKAVFLDINMPQISGIDMAGHLLELCPSMKIVFVTGTNARMEDLPEKVRINTLGFVYKPVSKAELKKCLAQIENRKRMMEVTTFGSFDCFIEGDLISFSSAKSKELLALLIAYNGKSLTMNQTITALWPDKDVEKAKKLYRDAVWRLRATLSQARFECVSFGRALLTLDKENIRCDYYDLLAGKKGFYEKEFMPSYEWSMEFQKEIDYLLLRDE